MFFLCFVLIGFGCYAADSSFTGSIKIEKGVDTGGWYGALAKECARNYISQGSMDNDLIVKMEISDDKKAQLYLKVGKHILQNMLVHDPITSAKNLQRYEYDITEGKDQLSQNSKLKRAKLQLLENGEPVFFWHCEKDINEKQDHLNFVYYKKKIHKIGFMDGAFSPNGEYLVTINNGADITVGSLTSTSGLIDRKNVRHMTRRQTIDNNTFESSSITCLGNNVYCFLGNVIFGLTCDPKDKTLKDGCEILNIHDLSCTDNSSYAKLSVEQQWLQVALFKKTSEYGWDLELLESEKIMQTSDKKSSDNALVITLCGGLLREIRLFDKSRSGETISTYEVASWRGLSNLDEYGAVDINLKSNSITLLKLRSRFQNVFAPIIEKTSFIPEYIKDIVCKFNDMQTNVSSVITVSSAKSIVNEILSVYKSRCLTQGLS